MNSTSYDIPDVKTEDDFTIIYKGRDDIENNAKYKENIIEIKTSRDELLRKLRYFKTRSNEFKYLNEYYIHDEFHVDIFQNFINSIKTNKINLNEENYLELQKLSLKYEFTELQEIIQKFIESRPDLQKAIDQLTINLDSKSDEENIDYEKELIIAKHLDFFLEKGILSKLPNSMLNRILNSPERILKNHHLLFNFIIEKITENSDDDNNEDLELLVTSLDYNEMDSDEILKLLENKKLLENFGPRHCEQKVKSIIEINKSNEERLAELEDEISKQKDNFLNETEKAKKKIENIEQKLEQQSKLIQEYQTELSKFATFQSVGDISEKVTKIERKQKEFERQIQKNAEEANQRSQKCENELTKIKAIIENHKKAIQISMKILEIGQINCQNEKIKNLLFDENEFKYQKGKEFEGIMHFLSEKTNGNIHDNGTIEITSNSIDKNIFGNHPKNLVVQNQNNYESNDDENIYVCFDFKDRRIQLTNYSIKSNKDGYNCFNLKSWIVEVSNDGESWTNVDEHQNDSALNESNAIVTFNIKKLNSFYRFVRLRQTGISWNSICGYYIVLNQFEIFGKLRKSKSFLSIS